MEPRNYGPKHYPAILRHLEKQHEVLMEAYRLMMHEYQKLQVEEQMLMRKLYDVVSAEGHVKKNDVNTNASYNGGAEHSNEEEDVDDDKEEQ